MNNLKVVRITNKRGDYNTLNITASKLNALVKAYPKLNFFVLRKPMGSVLLETHPDHLDKVIHNLMGY